MNISKILKFVLDFFKPAVDEKVGELKTNRDANIALIEAAAGSGVTTAESAVVGFVGKHLGNGPIGMVVQVIEAPLMAELAAAAGAGVNTIPELYVKAVAFLEKEEQYL